MRSQAINLITNTLCFSTKAQTLSNLDSVLKRARILPLYFFTVAEWRASQNSVMTKLSQLNLVDVSLVVRSSAISEDSLESSEAGKYCSIVDVNGQTKLIESIEKVIASFDGSNDEDQVLIQPYLSDVKVSGVAFGRDPNTDGPYRVINYNDQSNDTTAVTAGTANYKSHISYKSIQDSGNGYLSAVCALLDELETLFATDYIDIEFAVDQDEVLYLLQARPLIKQKTVGFNDSMHRKSLERISQRVALGMVPHPYLYGKRTIYGVMPDWNPAEIIGLRPKPLALSLYKELITDTVWAYQRDNYGYRNLRSFPLLVDFEGLPYIDVRVSFNSFLPKQLSDDLSERLVNYYLDRLIESPILHDKVEFDIIFSCYVLDLNQRLNTLENYGFTQNDRDTLAQSLTQLTNQIIHNQQGLWKKDLNKIEELKQRQERLFGSNLDPIAKMYWILEDCKRYGTLPFAGLARAGFIAVQILKSFVSVGVINDDEYTNFLTSVSSVSSNLQKDFCELSKNDFISKYGHLRPGTYDILSYRYDEAPDQYFHYDTIMGQAEQCSHQPFSLSIDQLRKIQEIIDRDKLEISVLELLEFIKVAIESREYSKFVFTRSVSEFLKLFADFCFEQGITRQDSAYINLKEFLMLYSSSVDPKDILLKSIEMGKRNYQLTTSITLPPLIARESDVWGFDQPESAPNFITQKSVSASIAFAEMRGESLHGRIVFIPSADPGYDWIFSHKIAGLVTKYGGVNSHMAIRSGELGIPAIIGAGDIKYDQWAKAANLYIDCLNQQVKII